MMKLSLDRDVALLHFLWKWKLASTSVLAARFYPESTLRAPYVRLWKLERGGYIKALASPNGRGFVWTLTKKGFGCIRHSLPRLCEDGFKAEHLGHDIVVTAAHLGDWIQLSPEGVELFSEQQLRRFDSEVCPSWVPDASLHRPDGYWRIRNGVRKRLLALEVELSQKQLDLYENVARFYSEDAEGCYVVWIVEGGTLLKRIQERIEKSLGTKVHLHSFMPFSDFQRLGWQAEFVRGSATGKTLDQLLEMSPVYGSDGHIGRRFFDFRKNPVDSNIHANIATHDFFNCVAPLPISHLASKGLPPS